MTVRKKFQRIFGIAFAGCLITLFLTMSPLALVLSLCFGLLFACFSVSKVF